MAANKSGHVFAYAETKSNRKETTFRDLSWQDMFPLIARMNDAIDHDTSDDDDDYVDHEIRFWKRETEEFDKCLNNSD